jgi:hypothetical protein
MLFITLGDGPIDPSPRAKVQPIKHRPTPRDRSRAPYVTSHTPPYVPPIKHRPMRDQSCPHAPILIAMREPWEAAEQETWLLR